MPGRTDRPRPFGEGRFPGSPRARSSGDAVRINEELMRILRETVARRTPRERAWYGVRVALGREEGPRGRGRGDRATWSDAERLAVRPRASRPGQRVKREFQSEYALVLENISRNDFTGVTFRSWRPSPLRKAP
jgi:hypothetical protein